MEFTKNYILFFLILLSSYLQATVVSFNVWNNRDKQIAVIGERHVNRVVLNDEWGLADKDHNDIFQDHLAQWIRSNKKIGFLLESSTESMKQLQMFIELDQRFTSVLGKFYWGMNSTLPLLAHKKNYSWGALNFITFDLRSEAIMASMEFVARLWEPLEEMKGDEESNAVKILNNKNVGPLFSSSIDTTISKYLNSIEQIIEIHNESDEGYCKIIIQLRDQVKELFKSNNDHDNTSIFKFFSDLILEKGLRNFMHLFHTLLQPISSSIANLGAQIELKKALIKYDFIVVFGGKLHADHINNYLKNNSFTNELSFEKIVSLNDETDAILPIKDQYLSNELLTKCLDSFTEKVVNNGLRNICAKCNKIEETPKEYKRCARCKQVHYCSVECQKNDWKEHKLNCKTL